MISNILYAEFMIYFVFNSKSPSWSLFFSRPPSTRLFVIIGFHNGNEQIQWIAVSGCVHHMTGNQFSLFCFNWRFISMLIDSANWIIFIGYYCMPLESSPSSFGVFVVFYKSECPHVCVQATKWCANTQDKCTVVDRSIYSLRWHSTYLLFHNKF